MSVYRFKVYFEDDENVYREIEIKATQTFGEFHNTIQKAINFDNAHSTSFFVSNDTWRKGKEIKMQSKIAAFIEDPHQKMVYEYDPDGGDWTLLIELIKILPDSPITYPRVNKSVGNAPMQYKITTPVEVKEDEDDETEVLDEEDNYVKSMSDHQMGENEEEEVEHEIKAHSKTSNTSEDEEEVVEEGTEGDNNESFDEDGGAIEEDEV